MILKNIIDQVAGLTALNDRSSLVQTINNAAQELWNTIDFPGVLKEEVFTLTADHYITLPYYVQQVRGIKGSSNEIVELNDKSASYQENSLYNNHYRYTIIKQTPLKAAIHNATTLKVVIAKAETFDVTVTFQGKNELSDCVTESLVFKPGETEKYTVNPFEDIFLATKDVTTNYNIKVYDGDGREIIFFPNHLREARNTMIQIASTEYFQYPIGTYIKVLYKPYLPWMENDYDSFPDKLSMSLLAKIRELVALESKDDLDRASIFSTKAATLFQQAADDQERGQTRRIHHSVNPFTDSAGIKL